MPVTVISAPCKKLGIGDHIVRWQRPKRGPQSMSITDFAGLPTSIEVREVHLLIQLPGFRPKEIILVTTLMDSKRYPKAKLAQLYQLRWQATEVNFLASQNYFEDGDDWGENSGDGAKRYLGAYASVQFAANFDVAIGAARQRVTLADFPTGHSTTVQPVQTRFGSSNCQKTLSALHHPFRDY